MGEQDGSERDDMWVTYKEMPRSLGHPFYSVLERELRAAKFDRFVEEECRRFYHRKLGRPSLPPGVYFRCLMVGYFEGIGSERGIAWRVADSLSLREFLGIRIGKNPPDHSTISRTRRRIDVETHRAVFRWVLRMLARKGLLKGKTLGIDATTLEANAALRSIVRRDTGQTYEEYLTELAKASGIEAPTRTDHARVDRKRPKKGSNEDWRHPGDPDARIKKMKDGRTHLAHKQEHSLDMETGAVVAVTVQDATEGDTSSIEETLQETFENLADVREDEEGGENVTEAVEEVVADKGYHSSDTLLLLEGEGIRSYVSEPERGRRRWKGLQGARRAVYANRRRKGGARGQRLLRRRGEILERSFAHALGTGGMRRTHLRRHENILKRALVHLAAFDLSLLMRKIFGVGTPRGLQGRGGTLDEAMQALFAVLLAVLLAILGFVTGRRRIALALARSGPLRISTRPWRSDPSSATGC